MNIDLIKPTAAVSLADIARRLELEGRKIIKLQTGDPDFPTHNSIIEAAYSALLAGNTHYSFSQGLPALRKQLAIQYSTELNSKIGEDQIIISLGAAEGFFSVIAALIEPEDEILILEPNWPTVDSLILLMGGKPIKIQALKSEDEIIEQLNSSYSVKTKMLCFNTPNNPTGIVMEQTLINKICNWAVEKSIFILADEVYRFLQFAPKHTTSLKYLNNFQKYIYLNSFSKKYAMTGWRIGYIIADEVIAKRILKPSQLAITNVAPFIQLAALEALTNKESIDYSNSMRLQYQKRRDEIISFCKILGIEFLFPDGAFYLFIKLPDVKLNDVDFCNKLLSEYNTCMVPGSAFGKSGSGYVRLSFANELESVKSGLKQFNELINNLR